MTEERRSSSPRGRVTLKRGRARPIWSGHPWVYSGAIASAPWTSTTPSPPGSVVEVADEKGHLIGLGAASSTARIAVRMLTRTGSLPDGGLPALLRARIAAAAGLRAAFGLPCEGTDAYRLLNGEGDGLPGVVCDMLGSLASVQLTTAAAESWLPLLLEALDAPLVQVGVPEDSARFEGIAPGERLGRGDLEEHVPFCENGIRWTLKPGRGQKTGFYTDQRDNRRLVGELAAGRSVLDAYCYTGGFGLNAARGGAREVVGVDSSGPAVSVAAGTARANDLHERVRFHKEDTIRFLRGVGERTFDLVVLDPPKLARNRAGLDDAYAKYRAINRAAIERVTPGGLLVSCSCSGLVDEEMFLRMLTDAAHAAGRALTVHTVRGPGPDHPTPVAFAEGRYLTFVLASVQVLT